MSRNKQGIKSGWKKRDKKFRNEQNARARANRERRAALRLFEFMAGRS